MYKLLAMPNAAIGLCPNDTYFFCVCQSKNNSVSMPSTVHWILNFVAINQAGFTFEVKFTAIDCWCYWKDKENNYRSKYKFASEGGDMESSARICWGGPTKHLHSKQITAAWVFSSKTKWVCSQCYWLVFHLVSSDEEIGTIAKPQKHHLKTTWLDDGTFFHKYT